MTAEIITKTQVRRARLKREVRLLSAGWQELSASKDAQLRHHYARIRISGVDQVVEKAFWFAECNLKPGFPTSDVRIFIDNATAVLYKMTGIERRMLREMGKSA